MLRYLLTVFTLTTLCLHSSLFAQSEDKGRISFYIENDIFTGSDRDYTNGGRLAWISDKKTDTSTISSIPRHLELFAGTRRSNRFFKGLWGFDRDENISYQYGIALTQMMFTPSDFEAVTPPPNERSYAGWLGLGFSIHASNERAINSVEFTFGTVGPDAFAEETQDFVHDVRKIDKFEGWDSQIPNELTFNLHLNQKRRFRYIEGDEYNCPFSLDGFTEVAASIGNYRTDFSIGWHINAGLNLPINFSDPRLSPTANSVSWNTDTITPKWSLYCTAGLKATAVLHDITIDGPLFRDYSRIVDREPFVGELFIGFGAKYKSWELSYIQTTRTREYKQQQENQEFGSLVIRYHY